MISMHDKHVLDGLSIATVVVTLAEWLPAVAAIFSIIWTVIRIYETDTVRRWLGKEPLKEEEE